MPLIGVAFAGWPAGSLVALATAPLALAPARAVLAPRDPARLNDALASTARLSVLYGAFLALGFAA